MKTEQDIFDEWWNGLDETGIDGILTISKKELKKIMRSSFSFGCKTRSEQLCDYLEEFVKTKQPDEIRVEFLHSLGDL